MTDSDSLLRPWFYRIVYATLVMVLLILALVPAGPAHTRVPGPDLMICLTAAWAVRRPEYVPPLLVGAMLLLADFLLQRPPGLWAAIAVVLTLYLRSQSMRLRELPFLSEWVLATAALLAAFLAYRVLLFVTVTPAPPAGPAAFHAAMTLLCYPPVAFLSSHVMRVRKLAPHETDMVGRWR